jgi:hypothetical protein
MKRVIIAALFTLALSTPATVKAEDYASFTDVLINTQWEDSYFDRITEDGMFFGIITYSFLENGDYVVTKKADNREAFFTEGAWKFGDGICWSSLDKDSLGNLMIYLPDVHCCYRAAFVGTKLILSAIAGHHIRCADKTLRTSQR